MTHHCDKHGPYTPRVLPAPFEGFPAITLGCRECSDEQARAHIAEQRAAEEARMLIRSRIPDDYRAATIAEFPIRNHAQRNAVQVCNWFVAEYEALRQSAGYGSWVVFFGTPGSGKTGLACAVGLALMRAEQPRCPLFHTVASLRRFVWDARSRGSSETNAMDELAGCELLIVDDIGTTTSGDAERALLLDLVNERYSRRRPLIITSNLSREQMDGQMEPRMLDRIVQRAVWAPCLWPSLRRAQQHAARAA